MSFYSGKSEDGVGIFFYKTKNNHIVLLSPLENTFFYENRKLNEKMEKILWETLTICCVEDTNCFVTYLNLAPESRYSALKSIFQQTNSIVEGHPVCTIDGYKVVGDILYDEYRQRFFTLGVKIQLSYTVETNSIVCLYNHYHDKEKSDLVEERVINLEHEMGIVQIDLKNEKVHQKLSQNLYTNLLKRVDVIQEGLKMYKKSLSDKSKLEIEAMKKELSEKYKKKKEKFKKEKIKIEEKQEKMRIETERIEKERFERDRIEKERLERERNEIDRLEKERIETERKEKNAKLISNLDWEISTLPTKFLINTKQVIKLRVNNYNPSIFLNSSNYPHLTDGKTVIGSTEQEENNVNITFTLKEQGVQNLQIFCGSCLIKAFTVQAKSHIDPIIINTYQYIRCTNEKFASVCESLERESKIRGGPNIYMFKQIGKENSNSPLPTLVMDFWGAARKQFPEENIKSFNQHTLVIIRNSENRSNILNVKEIEAKEIWSKGLDGTTKVFQLLHTNNGLHGGFNEMFIELDNWIELVNKKVN